MIIYIDNFDAPPDFPKLQDFKTFLEREINKSKIPETLKSFNTDIRLSLQLRDDDGNWLYLEQTNIYPKILASYKLMGRDHLHPDDLFSIFQIAHAAKKNVRFEIEVFQDDIGPKSDEAIH